MNNKGWMIATICLAVLGLIILLSLFNKKVKWAFIKKFPPILWKRREEYKINHFFSTVTGVKNYIRVQYIQENSFITLYRDEVLRPTTGIMQDIRDRMHSMIPDKEEAARIASRIIFLIYNIIDLEMYHITVEEFEELHEKVFFPKHKIFTKLFGCYFVREKPEIEKGVNASMLENCQLQIMKNQRVVEQALRILARNTQEIEDNKWELGKLTEKMDKSIEKQEELFGKLVMSNTKQLNTDNLNLDNQ